MGLLQRVFDEAGLATVSISLVKEITQLVKPSLACFVEHPFGLTLGEPGDKATQRAILRRCLEEVQREHAAGTIVDLGFRWERDQLREQQLAKDTPADLAALQGMRQTREVK